ncbi:hypothetical protein H7J06_31425 [Mycobacterium hodleri]|uniref:hypothetical protein n=1 Tax=Mycolicibacterium hodleri TaxID=49897 RepID=UPI0021F2F331|nr:hypothetical protein [Mycolicibacterium hodleri]MCV7137484.1 hypothetical protein [Mycolicibacterium hodleri]
MPKSFVLSRYHLANHRRYRDGVLGMSVRYVTSEGTVVEGVLSEHPTSPGGLQMAVITAGDRWAAVHAGETLEEI